MSSKDLTHRFIFDQTDIRGEITSLESSYREAFAHQSFPHTLRPLFGEFLAAASLLSEILKFEGILTLQAKGSGDIGLIMAETDHQGHVRGIIRMREDYQAEDEERFSPHLADLLPDGQLVITIEPNKGERYQGIIALEGETLSECISAYFSNSEQLPTYIKLFATEEHAGGLFLQCLPVQEVTDIEQRGELWSTAIQLASTCTEEELFTLDHETLLFRLFNELNCRLFEPKSIQFRCTCSYERTANALSSIGLEEALTLVEEQSEIKVDCQFCGKTYSFDKPAVQKIFGGDTIH